MELQIFEIEDTKLHVVVNGFKYVYHSILTISVTQSVTHPKMK